MISDLKFRLRMNFIETSVVYVFAMSNKLAHELIVALVARVDHDEQCL
jgi:hypothetical protein